MMDVSVKIDKELALIDPQKPCFTLHLRIFLQYLMQIMSIIWFRRI